MLLTWLTKDPIDNVTIGLGNGLAPNKLQAINWTNAKATMVNDNNCILTHFSFKIIILYGLTNDKSALV